MARDDLKTIDLADFSPGISTHYRTHTADQPTHDGYARAEGTWGCVSLIDGGIGPMPRHTIERQSLFTDWNDQPDVDRQWPTKAGPPADPAVYDHRIAILDARVISPVTYSPALNLAVDHTLPPVDVFMVRQFWLRRKTGAQHAEPAWFFSNHLEYLGPPYTRDGAANYWLDGISHPARQVHSSRWLYGGGTIAETRTVSPAVTSFQVGDPVVVAGMGGPRFIGGVLDGDPEGIDVAAFVSYPDYHTTFGSGPSAYAEPHDNPHVLPAPVGVSMPGITFGHQGRLMALARASGLKFARRLSYHGNDDGLRAASELVMYWPVNNIYAASGPTIATFMEEASSGYGTWCSVNANSLLLIKNAGGAVEIAGDVASPTVTRLPGVPSVGGRANRGVMTDKGFVYGTTTGVWMWTGSDTAVPLSDRLDPLHWLPDDPTIALRETNALCGSFAYRHPFVFAPNNYALDLRTGGWWRYAPNEAQDTASGKTFAFNEVDCNGNLWAFPASYVTPNAYGRYYDQAIPRADWAWQSQPLARSVNRRLDIRQLTIVASGVGRVKVTVTGIDGATDNAEFDVNGDNAQMIVAGVAVLTTDVEVDIAAQAHDASMPAPIVHRVSIGYFETTSIAGPTP